MKKSKTFLKAAVLSLAAAMMLTACGGKSEETSGSSAKKDALTEIRRRGKWKVLMLIFLSSWLKKF
jgi:putative glutamine transport system substrate-binding protein